MKFGYCVNMLARDAYRVGYEYIPALAEYGFDYVELPMAQMMDMDDAVFADTVVAQLKSSGLPCGCVNNLFPATLRLTGPDADHSAALEYLKRAFDRVGALGARRAVFGSSGARNVPQNYSHEDALMQIGELLPEMSRLAAAHGITLVIEPLNRSECNIINGIADAAALASAVNLANVMVLGDYYHMSLNGEGASNIADALGMLRHFHIARPLLRALPLPGDFEPYGELFAALRAAGYDERVSIEANTGGPFKMVRDSLAYLKTL